MNQRRRAGFSLLEVILALVVITVAGLGAYSLFDSGIKSNNITDATNEVVEIANVYTDLASSNLTNGVTDVPALLQNSGRLSSKYFSTVSSKVQVNNAFGKLDFSVETPTAYSFAVKIPLGCLAADSTVPEQFFNKVRDVYSCNDTGGKDLETDCTSAVTDCSSDTSSSLTLYFNMNN